MSAATDQGDEPTLAVVAGRIDELTDLFKRRLLEDRSKSAIIEDLQERLTRSDKITSAEALKPVVESISLIIERALGAEPSASLTTSIVSELEYVLEAIVGVTTISPSPGDEIDRLRHEIASASGEGSKLLVAELIRAGYEKDGVVLRPARVSACRAPSDETGGDG